MFGIGKSPGTGQAVNPLDPKLRAAFLLGNPVFQVSGVPSRTALLRRAGAPTECCAISHAASAPCSPAGADQFSQTRRILEVHGLHSRMIRAAKLVRRKKLFAHPMIFGAKTEQFPANCFN
jgi:hypothetical protein